jgi:ABC-type branched-subunit amino acid transport system ATPase component/branched-subunit amino acid ABC-type transport system permease component
LLFDKQGGPVNEILPFIVIGLTTGSVYGLAAVGLVLTYKTSRIFNFAHGSIATLTAFLFFALVYRANLPWPVAFGIDIVLVGPLIGLGFQVMGRRLSPLSSAAKVLATIGLILFITGVVDLWGPEAFSNSATGRPPALPGSLVRIFGVNVGVDQIIIVVVGLAATGLLHLTLEYTRLGRSMRAVVDAPDLLALTGKSPLSAQRFAWAIGISFVTLSGLLLALAPTDSVPIGDLYLLVLQALGAAAIGGFRSLPLTYVGGLFIGVASALATKWAASITLLQGFPSALPFIVLFLVLVAVPRYLAPQSDVRAQPARDRVIEVSGWWRLPLGLAVTAALVVVPLTHSVQLIFTSNESLAYTVIFLGLSLLVRTSAQVSLCQMGLAAIGAATFSHALGSFGIPWLWAVILGGLAAALVGALVAIPAIRVAGVYLAIGTFGFGVLLEELVYPTQLVFGNGNSTIRRPSIGPLNGADDTTYFVVLVLFAGLAMLAVMLIKRARLGRLLRGLGDSPMALEAQGTSINLTRVAIFAISAFFAGVGGALLVGELNFLQAGPFSSTNSLIVIAILLTFRVTEPISSLAAAAALTIVPSFLSPRGAVWWLDIGFGAAAVLVALTGAAQWLPRWQWRKGRRSDQNAPLPVTITRAHPAPRTARAGASSTGLDLIDVTVRYKGIVAVNHLSLKVAMGHITGLIGPNGAGKTTTFNFCSGLVHADSGRLLLHGRDITALGPPARARRGIGRTFQQPALFESLTVHENIDLGAEARDAGPNILSHLIARPTQRASARARASEALEIVGIGHLAMRDVRSLSTSERRLVEFARCLAGTFDVLLLDEPSAGLDVAETARFAEILDSVVRYRSVGILLVEHDMSLVTRACSEIYVLDFGELVFQGTPPEILASSAVRAAYLGTTTL